MRRKLTALFLCTGNSCRSVMGETLLRHIASDRFDVASAGTAPKGINPLARQVLEEIGVDTTGVRSKHLNEFVGQGEIDFAIIVCDDAAESCPRTWPGLKNKLLWPFEDPPAFPGSDEERLAKFREVRDAIRTRLIAWIAELEAAGRFDEPKSV